MPYARKASGPSPSKEQLQCHPGQVLWCWPVISMMLPSRSCRELHHSLDMTPYIRLSLQLTRADMGAQQHKSQPSLLFGQLPAGLDLIPHLSPFPEDTRQVHISIQHCLPVVDRRRNTSYLPEHLIFPKPEIENEYLQRKVLVQLPASPTCCSSRGGLFTHLLVLKGLR